MQPIPHPTQAAADSRAAPFCGGRALGVSVGVAGMAATASALKNRLAVADRLANANREAIAGPLPA